MKTMKKLPALFLALIMLLSLCACGSAKSGSSADFEAATEAAAPAAAYSTSNAMYDSFAAEEDMAAGIDSGLGMSAAPVPSPAEKEGGKQ